MITGYTRPQLLIRQVLEVLPDQEERTLHAFAVGSQYDLHRYTNSEERAEMVGAPFVENHDLDAQQVVPYEGLESHNVVDQAFTRLYGEKLEGQVFLENSSSVLEPNRVYDFKLPSLLYPNRIQVIRRQALITAHRTAVTNLNPITSATLNYGGSGYAPNATIDQMVIGGTGTGAVIRMTTNASGVVTAVSVVAPGKDYLFDVPFSATAPNSGSNVGKEPDENYTTSLIPELHGRPIKPGDIVYATQNVGTSIGTTRRPVREVMRDVTPSSYGTNEDLNDKKFLPSVLNPIQTNTASIGNISTPPNWNLGLATGTVLGINVSNPGAGYTTPPDVTITPPIEINSGGLVWPATQALGTAVLNDAGQVDHVDVDFAGTGYYYGGVVHVIVEDGGSGYDVDNPPTILVSAGTDHPVLEPVIEGDKITGVKILDPGTGMSLPLTNFVLTGALQSITLSGGAGSGAKLIAVPNGGSIRWIDITNHGLGYTGNATVSGPTGGSNFAAKAYFGANEFATSNPGSGYAVGDVVEVNVGTAYLGLKTRLKVTGVFGPGSVLSADIVPGYEGRYDGAVTMPVGPNQPTTALTGDGIDWDVELFLGVWLVRVTNPGKLYTAAPIVFTPAAGGSGAAATASLVSPFSVSFSGGGGSGAAASMDTISNVEDWNGLVEGSTYDGKYAERYTITVTETGDDADDTKVRIRSASGAFSANSVVAHHYGLDYIIDDPALGGLVISLRPESDTMQLGIGDTFTFVVVGTYLPLNLASKGQLLQINAPRPGTGFTPGQYDLVITSPSEPGGVQATAKGTITGLGEFDPASVIITEPGSGYIAPPLVTVPPSAGAGTNMYLEAIITTAENSRDLTVIQSSVYTGPRNTRYQVKVIQGTSADMAEESFNGAIVRVSDTAGIDEIQEYEVVQGQQYDLGTYGLKFMFPANQATPSGVTGGTAATALASVAGGIVTAVDITDAGFGYTQPPSVGFSGGPGSGATAHAVIHEGKVIAIVIDNEGSGYSSAPDVLISAPTGFQGGLRTGDNYYIDAKAEAADGDYSTIVLSGQAVDISGWSEDDRNINKFNLDVRVLYSGIVVPRRNTAPDLAWVAGTAAEGGILVRPDLALELTDRDVGYEWVPFKNATASRLFAHWRGLVPATSGSKISLYYSEQGISEAFGKIDMDNPVCYGAIMAFRGGQEKPIFAARLASDDVAGHTAMIRQAEHVEGIYAIALTTYDLAIKEMWAAHVNKMSLENWKLWRRVYIGTQNPGSYAAMTTQEDGSDFVATVTTNASGNVRVICANGDFLTRNILPGDLYRTNFYYDDWGNPAFEEYVVYTVNTEDELILETGPASPISPATKFEIWRPDNGLSQAAFVGEQSDNFLNRRVVNVWSDEPNLIDTDGQMHVVPVYYLACEIAGLRAAVLPQQGLTYTELDHSLDGAPLMFTKYSEEELNLAASLGTWIVTQEQEDGPIFIRHQLTTETNKGILYYEDSIGANVDNIAYAVKDIFQPYIGKRNTNVETLEEMETKLRDLLDSFKKNPGGFTNIGPALILWRDMAITIDPVFKDRINVRVTLELPLPINTIIVTLLATTASDETIASINVTVNAPPEAVAA